MGDPLVTELFRNCVQRPCVLREPVNVLLTQAGANTCMPTPCPTIHDQSGTTKRLPRVLAPLHFLNGNALFRRVNLDVEIAVSDCRFEIHLNASQICESLTVRHTEVVLQE